MTDYELTFETDELGDDLEVAIAEELDGFIGGHAATTLVTLTATADDAVTAARHAVESLQQIGAKVVRMYPDLVTRKSIAHRAGVSTQAVGLWVRGERQAANAFPAPFTHAGGGLWLWSEVNEWLKSNDLQHDDDVDYPSRRELDIVNGWLASGHWMGQAMTAPTVSSMSKVDVPGGPRLAIDTRSWTAGTAWERIDYELAS